MRRRFRAAIFFSLAFCLLGNTPSRSVAEDTTEPSVLAIIRDAFDRMFNYPSVRTVTFRVHRAGGRVAERDFDIVYKRVEGRGHTLVRFTAPEYLRNSAMLIIERPDGVSDTWLYRPSDRRARRISTAQRADSFFGSDFTLEDLEHHDWASFDLQRLPDETEQGQISYVVEAIPKGSSQYRRMLVWIEKERRSLLRIDFFQGNHVSPAKRLTVDPAEMEFDDGVVKPRRMWLRQIGRDQSTEVLFRRIETDAEITDRVFTLMRLEQSGRDLYQLVDRLNGNDE